MKTILGRSDQALCFAAVADGGGFTAAAERLGCSKAHVSKQVAALERELGAQLLLRSTRRVRLTESGRLYLDYCRGLRDTLEEAERAVSALRADLRGRLRISAPISFGDAFLPHLLMAFSQRHPEVEIDIDLSTTRRDLIADGFDLAIRSTRTLEQRLIARPLGVIRDLAACAPGLLQHYPLPQHPQDLAALPCLFNPHFGDDGLWVFERGTHTETVSVSGPLRVNNYTAIRHLGLGGAGVVRLPAYLIGADIAAGKLQRLCPDWHLIATPLYLVYPEQRHQPLRTRVFIDYLLQWFAQEPQCHWFR